MITVRHIESLFAKVGKPVAVSEDEPPASRTNDADVKAALDRLQKLGLKPYVVLDAVRLPAKFWGGADQWGRKRLWVVYPLRLDPVFGEAGVKMLPPHAVRAIRRVETIGFDELLIAHEILPQFIDRNPFDLQPYELEATRQYMPARRQTAPASDPILIASLYVGDKMVWTELARW